MKRMLIAGALALAALAGAGCSGCAPLNRVVEAVNAPSRTVIDDKAVLAAEVAYAAALDTVLAGVADGRIKGQDAARARDAIVAAERFRHPDGATAGPTTLQLALKAGNATDLRAKFNAFRALTAQLAAIAAANGAS